MFSQGDSVQSLLPRLIQAFRACPVVEGDPEREAHLLLRAVLGTFSIALNQERTLSPDDLRALQEVTLRRLAGEPLSRIMGKRGFWKDTFRLTPDVLDPRPETEGMIETTCRFFEKDQTFSVIDVGVGSGCLLLSILRERPRSHGLGLDVSWQALDVARQNAVDLGLQDRCSWVQGRWLDALKGSFDLIVSNPPYIPHSEIPHLSPAVRSFDPHLALDGGRDGLDSYRAMSPKIPNLLRPGGFFIAEFGEAQEKALEMLFSPYFQEVHFENDLSGRPRYLWVRQEKFD